MFNLATKTEVQKLRDEVATLKNAFYLIQNGGAKKPHTMKMPEKCLEVMKQGGVWHPKKLAREIRGNRASVHSCLGIMVRQGKIKRAKRGYYECI